MYVVGPRDTDSFISHEILASFKAVEQQKATLEQQMAAVAQQLTRLCDVTENHAELQKQFASLEAAHADCATQLDAKELDIQNLLKDSDELVAKLEECGVGVSFTESGIEFVDTINHNGARHNEVDALLGGDGKILDDGSTLDDLLADV